MILSPLDLFCFTLAGLLVGSFLNVVACRLPKRQSLVTPRSHCPHCQTTLRPFDLIPVFSWLLLRGRCRTCRASINWKYPAVELLTATVWAAVAWRYGISWETGFGLAFASLLIPLALIDQKSMILPNELSYTLILLAVLFRSLTDTESFSYYAAGGLTGAGVLFALHRISPYLFGMQGMGLGDVKLMAGIGMAVGLQETFLSLFISSFTGVVLGGLRMARGKLTKRSYFPFGPCLALGGILSYLAGDIFWRHYLSFFSR
ncbi:prepilin peptidase [Effusibacillus dendaii]|uniref:Prepilin leader peptidase/N-methyltransferase n=1 Tax=Effusibacillus dendaii TaxID=2743772 RepID=A0A7I8D7L4_9BACL|nr:A24 family peptidase [Effusibacillus dendaii]BCJ86094.1 prepilin peptidase [Effusibacillus dendaii]